MTREKIDYNGEIDLRHFELLRCVGKGAFGKVRIVEKKDTKQLYALKYINKMQCIKMRAVPNIFRERAILEEIDHPFVVNLRFAFQDDENMFMVLDLMNGGDVRYHLDRLGGFSPDVVRFIAMELVCALSYLHKKHIVHRDLKPDNVLFDKDGHVHLTDFNIAVHYNIKRLTSQSGTLSYMAPEVFTKTGYSWPIDWWSLGIFLYEALFGKRPFRGQTDEELRDNICHQDLHVPIVNLVTNKPVALSSEGENLLRRLLERDVRKRIGCGTMGVEEIEAHPWFRGIDWDTVQRMKYQPTFVPDPNQANFDPTFDLEELLLDDNPLNYRPRKKKSPVITQRAVQEGAGT
ncbi:kinase-like protein [Powellomyces hirtus]|nr:kinase-like protein [Powellomyces hirtus]